MGSVVVETAACFVVVPVVPILKPDLRLVADVPGKGEAQPVTPVVYAQGESVEFVFLRIVGPGKEVLHGRIGSLVD